MPRSIRSELRCCPIYRSRFDESIRESVLKEYSRPRCRIIITDFSTGTGISTNILGPEEGGFSGPTWSPDETDPLIAFEGNRSIETVRPNGSNLRTIVTTKGGGGNSNFSIPGSPIWSPTGSHLIYLLIKYINWRGSWNVLRVTVDGDHRTSLTKDIEGFSVPFGWR